MRNIENRIKWDSSDPTPNYSAMLRDNVAPANHVCRKKTKPETTSSTQEVTRWDFGDTLQNEFILKRGSRSIAVQGGERKRPNNNAVGKNEVSCH